MQSEKKRNGFLSETDQILKKTKDLTDFLCQTEDYQRYQRSLTKLKKNNDTYKKLNEFRRKNLYLEDKENDSYEAADSLYEEYKDILMEPSVMDFLTSEEHVNMMLRKVFDSIAEEIRIDISYMD